GDVEVGQPVAEGAVEHAVGPGRGVAAGGLGIGADRPGQISGQVAEHADAVLGVVDRVDRGLPEQGVPLVQQDYRHGDGVVDYLVDDRLLRAVLRPDQPRTDEEVRLEVAFDGQP